MNLTRRTARFWISKSARIFQMMTGHLRNASRHRDRLHFYYYKIFSYLKFEVTPCKLSLGRRKTEDDYSLLSRCTLLRTPYSPYTRVGIRPPFLVEWKFHGTGSHGTEPMEPNGTIVPLRVTSKEEDLTSINSICDTHLVRVS